MNHSARSTYIAVPPLLQGAKIPAPARIGGRQPVFQAGGHLVEAQGEERQVIPAV
jgi:hypothetical protein